MKQILTFVICFYSVQIFAGGKVLAPYNPVDKLPAPLAITLSVLSVTQPTCQKANGKIIVQASGGVAPYNYTITGPYAPQPSGVFWGLVPATYTVKATDAILQTASQQVTLINTFLEPSVSVTGGTRPTGCITYDATLTLTATGGLAPYQYSLDNVNYQASNMFTNLTAGSYNYAVKDANGCTSNLNLIVNRKIIYPSCSMFLNGWGANIGCDPFLISLNLNGVTGGTPPYIYSKDGINYQSSNYFNDLTEGLNTFWIKDVNSIVLLYSVSFFDDCNPSFLVYTTVQPAQCGQNGVINITATNGTAPYQYSLDGINYQTGNQFTGLAPGNYTVRVKDFYNLISSKFVVVPNSCISVSSVITNSTCGNRNGKIEMQAVNGISPYLFSLDGVNYSTVNVFNNLMAGSYTAYAIDAIGRIGTQNIVVSNIAGPQITLINTTATNCDNRSGSITVTVTNGTVPYSYSLNGTVFQSSSIFSGLQQGSYIVTVKDANNCIDTKPAFISMTGTPPIVNLGNDTTLCEGPAILLNATNNNSIYLWQDASTNATYLVTQTGRYFVTVNKQGCITKDTIDITYQLKPRFTLGPDKSVCLGNPLTLDPKINSTGLTYLWQDGAMTPTYKVTQPGNYGVSITNNCGSTADDIIIKTAVCELYVPNSFTPNDDTKNDIFKANYGENVTTFYLQVYNRYGQIVFETKDKSQGWDGKYKGTKQPNDSYVWLIQYRTNTNNNLQNLQGTVLLIR